MLYLLDTNICIYVINERPQEVLQQFLVHEPDSLGISAVAASELYWGVRKSGSVRNLRALEKLLAPLHGMDFGLEAAQPTRVQARPGSAGGELGLNLDGPAPGSQAQPLLRSDASALRRSFCRDSIWRALPPWTRRDLASSTDLRRLAQ